MTQTEIPATRTPRRLPLRIVPKTGAPERIVGGAFGKVGRELAFSTVGVDEAGEPDSCCKAMVRCPAEAGIFLVGYGATDRLAAVDLLTRVAASAYLWRTAARAAHKRKERVEPTRASIYHGPDCIVLVVNDVLTKNDRYARGHSGTFEKPQSKRYKAAVAAAAAGAGYVPPVKRPAIPRGPDKRKASVVFGAKTITSGLWSLEVFSVWPKARHHADGTDTANGDADAPISMMQDAMQRAGIIDDDMRIVSTAALASYSKDERRTVAVLRKLGASTYDDEVARMRDYEALAAGQADASKTC